MPAEPASTGVDLSLVIAVAALVLSALSPLITSWIGGIFRLKEKSLDINERQNDQEIEFYYRHRAEVIEQYIKATGRVIELDTLNNEEIFGSTMGEVYLYVDESLWPLLDSITDYIHTGSHASAKEDFIKLCKALSYTNIRTKDQRQPQHTDNPQPKDV